MATDPGGDAQKKLLRVELRRQLAVISEFEKIQKRLTADIADLLERIDKERRIDGNASPGLLMRKARLSQLLDEVTKEIQDTSKKLADLTGAGQSAAVDIAKQQAAENPQIHANLGFFDAPATRELIGLAGDGEPLALHFAKLTKHARAGMFDALFHGIATGQPNSVIAKAVKDSLNGTTAQAMTIVRTETNRAYREASRQFYDETAGVIGWRWVAALDLRTCPICWALHGRIFKNKTKFGTHPNCRCTLVPVFPEDPKPETGPEVFAKLNDTQKQAIIGPKRLDLYNQGANLSDFVETKKSVFGIGRQIKPLDRTTFKPKPREPIEPARRRGPGSRSGPGSTVPAVPVPAPVAKPTPPAVTPKPALTAAIKPGAPVPKFADAKEAAAYMSKRFPGTQFDYAGMHLELINSNAAEMARLMDQYPETAEQLKYVGTYKDKTKTAPFGFARMGDANAHNVSNYYAKKSQIAYNLNKFNSAKDWQATKKQSFELGWSAAGQDYSTTTHEFGHSVDSWIKSLGINDAAVSKVAFPDGRSEINNIAERLLKEHRPKTWAELSGYAIDMQRGRKSQKAEQFAEAFNMMHNRPAKDWPVYVRALKYFIEWLQEKPTYKAAEQTIFADLTPAEQTAAKAEFNELIKALELKIKK